MKKALITGITGQDGSYLAELLLEKGYEVHGMVRRSSTETLERIEHIKQRVHLVQGDLLDEISILHTDGTDPAGRNLQPGRPVLRAHLVEPAPADRRIHRPGGDPHAGRHAHRLPQGPLLPGLQ
jgi:nucleoside-diphosphate-sugar epimerase